VSDKRYWAERALKAEVLANALTQISADLRVQLAERDRQIAGAWKALNAVPWAWTADLDPLFRALAEPDTEEESDERSDV